MSNLNDKAWALLDIWEGNSQSCVETALDELKAALPPRKTQEELMAEFVAAAKNLSEHVSSQSVAGHMFNINTANKKFLKAKEAAGL